MNNPIIQRELVGMLRTWRAFALQLLLIVALTLLVLLRWPTDARLDITGEQARQVMQLFGYGVMVGLILLAPVFPATSIVHEKKSGTLELLLNSPLSAWSIMFGKLVGVLGYLLLLVVLSLPAAAACFTMGGVESQAQVLKVYLILVLLSVQYATLGLLISSYASSTDSALRWTYGGVLLLVVVSLGPYQFLQSLEGVPEAVATLIDWIRCLSPIPAMQQVLRHGALGYEGTTSQGDDTMRFALLAILTSAFFSIWTMVRLNHRMLDKARPQGKITDERSTMVQLYRRMMYLWFFDPQRRSHMIGRLSNPVMMKEFRCRRFGRANWMMRLISLCLMVCLALMIAAAKGSENWGIEKLGGIMVVFQFALVLLVTPSLASGLISTERESQGWQLLKMTPLSTTWIVVGKLMSVVWPLALLIMATLPGYLVLIWIAPGKADTLLEVLKTLGLTAVLAILLSAASSSLFKRTATATVVSYTVLTILIAGTMFFWLLRHAPFSDRVVEVALMFNPLAGALSLMHVGVFADYNLIPVNWWIISALSGLSLIILVVRTWRLSLPE